MIVVVCCLGLGYMGSRKSVTKVTRTRYFLLGLVNSMGVMPLLAWELRDFEYE